MLDPAFDGSHAVDAMHQPHDIRDHLGIAAGSDQSDSAVQHCQLDSNGLPCSRKLPADTTADAGRDKFIHQLNARLWRLGEGRARSHDHDVVDAVVSLERGPR